MATALVIAGLSALATPARARVDEGRWVATWVSAQQLTEPANLPPAPGLAGATLRQIIQPALAGGRVRVRFSNQYGEKPVVLTGAQVAKSTGGSTIDVTSAHKLTFGGEAGFTVLPGTQVVSDDVALPVAPLENLAVSVQIASAPENVTGHPGSRTTSFLQPGAPLDAAALPEAKQTDHWYLLASVEVLAEPRAGAIVVMGDSITDGRGSTTNQNDRWPNLLARRLQAVPELSRWSVVNQGAGGGRVLRDGLGDSALRRFDRDVLAVPGVECLVIFEGVNDLGTATGARARGEQVAPAKELIAAYHQMIVRAHSHGIRVIGATIMPFEGFTSYFTPETEAERQSVNDWIRHGGEFDGVIDFDAVARDPAHASRLAPAVDGGDHLHPSAAGYRIMAQAIDLALFSRPASANAVPGRANPPAGSSPHDHPASS